MKNEHRKIGSELALFDLSDFSSGMVSWFPKGFHIYQKIEQYLRSVQHQYGYHEIKSPLLANSQLWQQSGHLDKFKDNMFMLEHDDSELALKPMNCPFHIAMFKRLCQSYRQLPLRLAEFGLCHRNEASGALNGLLRLRSFNQDDGHVFCRRDQIQQELFNFVEMLYQVYQQFGFERDSISVKISLRPDKRSGDNAQWDEAEHALQQGLQQLGIPFELLPDEGAFYGPKVEFSLKDSLSRQWQCGTFQLDFILAKQLDASFVDEQGQAEYPVILHRAVLGSLERFIAILLEHYQGKLPLWLNPNAVSILPVGDKHLNYANDIAKRLRLLGVPVSVNIDNDSVGYKLRQHFNKKGLYALIVGDDEMAAQQVTVREKKANSSMAVADFVESLQLQMI